MPMHQAYAPVRKPSFHHGITTGIVASRQPSAWEAQGARPAWTIVHDQHYRAQLNSSERLFGQTGWRPRMSRSMRDSRPAGVSQSFPDLREEEGKRSHRAWSASGWSPPPRRVKTNTKAPLSLDDAKARQGYNDAKLLREYEDQMAGFGPFPDPTVSRQRQRRGKVSIDRLL